MLGTGIDSTDATLSAQIAREYYAVLEPPRKAKVVVENVRRKMEAALASLA
jgi:hypothetical protein